MTNAPLGIRNRSSARHSEAQVARGAVGLVGAASVDAVAVAVRGVAQVRAAAHHAVGAPPGTEWVVNRADGVVARGEPVRTPLPDVAGHVVQAVAVRRERAHRRGPSVAVVSRVLAGEGPLEHVPPAPAPRFELVAPGVVLLLEAAARRALPLGLGGQPRAAPKAVR